MIDLDFNDGHYDGVSESLSEDFSADENISVSDDAATDVSDRSEHKIFTLARSIAERGNRYRSLRRSSSIL